MTRALAAQVALSPEPFLPEGAECLVVGDRRTCVLRFSLGDYRDELYELHSIPRHPRHSNWGRTRRAEHLAGRLAARECLSALGADGPVGVGPAGEPVFPAGLHGSVSHTRDLAAATCGGVNRIGGVGIDVEEIVAPLRCEVLYQNSLTHEEKVNLRLRRKDRTLLTSIFSAKEAFYKAIYPTVRRFVDFDEVRVSIDEFGFVKIAPCAELKDELASFSEFRGTVVGSRGFVLSDVECLMA